MDALGDLGELAPRSTRRGRRVVAHSAEVAAAHAGAKEQLERHSSLWRPKLYRLLQLRARRRVSPSRR